MKKAFTLVELLTVLAIVLVLTGLVLASVMKVKERGRRTACANNLRQLIQAALMYADEDKYGNLSSALHDTNDVMTFLYPAYIPTLATFICPSTKNYIRRDQFVRNPFTGQDELYDLTGYAGDVRSPGTSYELFGFMNYTSDTTNYSDLWVVGNPLRVMGVKKTLSTVANYRHMYKAFGLQGVQAGPSRIWLILDGDEPPGHQNYPDANNNHGETGGNVSFCDGHVEWVRRNEYVYRYELSQDENRTTP